MIRVLLTVCVLMISMDAFAYDMKKCFGFVTKDAMWRKYDFKYLAPTTHPSDSVNVSVPTDTTSKEGITKYYSENSTQGATYYLDPKVSTNSSTAQSQFMSSWGPCAMFGQKHELDKRDNYIALNWEYLEEEIAVGAGEHIDGMLELSGCNETARVLMLEGLRSTYGQYQTGFELAHQVDLMAVQPEIRGGCYSRS